MNMIYIYILNESSLHNYKLLHLYIVSYIELMRSYKKNDLYNESPKDSHHSCAASGDKIWAAT